MQDSSPQRSLSTLDVVALIVGLVIGVGIFRAPQAVAENAGGAGVFLSLWLAGGAVSLIGALCYAELATAYPSPGGEYHFLHRAFGHRVAFLFAWARSTVIQTGSIALLAFVFGDYAAELFRLGPGSSPLLAALAIVALTTVNLVGLRHGRRTQNTLTVIQMLGVAAVLAAGLLLVSPAAEAPATLPPGTSAGPGPALAQLGLAMVFVLLTFGGWNEAAYVSAEVRDDRRGMIRALLWGIGTITVVYLLVNLAYLRGLGFAGIAGSSVVAADLMRAAVGPWGAAVLSLVVAISALCSANATIITGGRSTYALGRDFALFGFLGEWRERGGTPANALVLQGVVALVLVGFGAVARSGFEAMVAYTAPVFWFFLSLVALALIVLRRREPARPHAFRVPLYPVTPLVFFGASVFMFYSSVRYAGIGALVGVGVMAAGVPLLLVARPRPLGLLRRAGSI